MRIVTTGSKELLFNMLQCIRDVIQSIDNEVDAMKDRKTDCCSSSEAP